MMLVKSGKAKFWLQCNIVTFVVLFLPRFTFSMEESDYTENGFFKITPVEKTVLRQFRALMRPILTNNFLINDDFYLIRWLRSQDFNIPEARQMLMENLRWRRAHNIDALMSEDFSDMRTHYPYHEGVRDKQGRPVISIPVGRWNIRRAARTGRLPRLIRYMTKLLEMGANDITEYLEQGQNVSQFKIIANLDGFTAMLNACPLCLPVYSTFLRTLQNYYPGYADEVILLNTPPAFRAILNTLEPFLTTRTKRSIRVFGRNTSQWMPYLERDISKEDLDKLVAHQWQ